MAKATKKAGSDKKTGRGTWIDKERKNGKGKPAPKGGKPNGRTPNKNKGPNGGNGQGGEKNGATKRKRGDKPIRAMKPLTPNQIARQARQHAVTAYKPSRIALRQEGERINAQQKKRQADALQFQDWLERREALMDLQGDASDAALQQARMEGQQQIAERYAMSENTLLDQARSQSVSNVNMADYEGFQQNTRAINQLQLGEVQLDALRTVALDNDAMRAAISENTMATLAGMRNQQNSEYWNAMRDLGDRRLQLDAEQRGEFIKQKNTLLDREISKAQSNREFKLSKQTSKQKLRLEQAGLRLEAQRIQNELKIAQMNNASDERIAALKAKSDQIVEQIKNKGKAQDSKPEIDKTDVRARKKLTREINQTIGSAISTVRTNKKARRLWRKGNKTALANSFAKAGIPGYLTPVIFDLMTDGKLSPRSRKTLRSVGAYVDNIQGSKVRRKPKPDPEPVGPRW